VEHCLNARVNGRSKVEFRYTSICDNWRTAVASEHQTLNSRQGGDRHSAGEWISKPRSTEDSEPRVRVYWRRNCILSHNGKRGANVARNFHSDLRVPVSSKTVFAVAVVGNGSLILSEAGSAHCAFENGIVNSDRRLQKSFF